jgi:carbon monoxide dehydrogenase subunit G
MWAQPASGFGGRMANVTKTTYLSTGSDKVWEVLRDPGRANELITFLGEVTVDGNTRTCALGDDVLEELIVDIDDATRRFVYSIRRGPLEFAHHSASMQAIPEGEGTRFVWVTDFLPDEAAPAVDEVLTAALGSIEAAFG